MPDQQTETLQNTVASSFIGLQSYSEDQSKFFFGRDEEISILTTLIKSNTLTIVFGKSGTGKTSLLNAGVFPKLRKDYCLPFRIRLEFNEDSKNLIAQVKNVLKKGIDKYGFKVESYPGGETLWEYFHKEILWRNITPILVFDQFEEMFTLAKKNPRFAKEEMINFWGELSDLIENEIPDKLSDVFLNNREQITYNYKRQPVKVVFAFREEFLPEFESIPSSIPSLKYSRFRLMAMNDKQAYDVITKTWNEKIEPEQARKIITYFTTDEKLIYISDIEPSLLSQVCFYLDKERLAQGKNKITAAFLSDYPKETILRSIYNEVLSESYDAVGRVSEANRNAVVYNPVKVFVEDKLITNEGYRIKYGLTEYDENIRPGLEVLKGKYFVRDDGKTVELTHDVLAPIIKDDREDRMKRIADAEAKKRAWRRGLIIVGLMAVIGFGFWAYAAYRSKKALDAETNAINHKDSLLKQIAVLQADSTRLAQGRNRSSGRGASGFSGDRKPSSDSARIDSLQTQLRISNDRIESLETNIDLLDAQLSDLNINYRNSLTDNEFLKGSNSDLLRKIDDLNKQLEDYKNDLAMWRSNFDKLQKEYYDYKISHPYTYPGPYTGINGGQGGNGSTNATTDAEDLDSNSLKLKLFYNFSKAGGMNKLGNFPVYIIPNIRENRSIIRDAEYYEMYCNENKLRMAKGVRKAKFSNGYYYFPNLPVGNYLIKICTYYGGYYFYNKKSMRTDSLRLDASPPIR